VTQDWLLEFLLGMGRMFLHPVFYLLFLLAAILGVSRVKRERKNFHVRVENAYFELRQLVPLGLLNGLILSLIIIGAGIVIPLEAIILIAVITILVSFTTKIRLLSPAYTVGFAFFAYMLVVGQKWTVPYFPNLFQSLDDLALPAIAILLGLLLIAEGIFIFVNGKKGTSPKKIKSKRGSTVGVHEIKRPWLLPVFLLIPGDILELPFTWWPVFSVGGETFSLFLVPFAVGIHQQVQSMLPKLAVQVHGKRVITFGIVIAILASAGYWYPLASIVVVALAIAGREWLTFSQRSSEQNSPFYFTKKNKGLMILGILLDSPALKMGLQVGEVITKVNGQVVQDEEEMYEALQRNRAHCKLEVLDVKGEIRFVQRALYEGDHHELGLLIVQDEKQWDNEAV
jgi:hypothetical protein